MARKTFVSYKYEEACDLRDEIIKCLGDDAIYYTGETSESPDLTDETAEKIKESLKNMMYNTSVTIVILSPSMKKSKWIDWELEYCLKEITRKDRTSKTNGIVAVVMKYEGKYEWLIKENENCHKTKTLSYDQSKIYSIINENHFNSIPPKWHCDTCKTYDSERGSYISYVKEEVFLKDPNYYIEIAYEKSEDISKFKLKKLR